MDAAVTFSLKGATYQIGRLTPKKAFHVSRRLAPFLGAIIPQLSKLFAADGDGAIPNRDEFIARGVEILPGVADIMAEMKNEDVDYIIDTCLTVVRFKQETGWAPLAGALSCSGA